MNGKMKEAETGVCELSSLVPEVFMALVEYAYRGYLLDSARAFSRKFGKIEGDLGEIADRVPIFDYVRCTEALWEQFRDLKRIDPLTMKIFGNVPKDSQDIHNKTWQYQSAYLFYAKVATMAHMYLMSELTLEASGVLHHLLKKVMCRSGPPGTLLKLLTYVNSDVDVLPAVRQTVMSWFASTGPAWHHCKRYRELLENDPELALEIYFLTTVPIDKDDTSE